MENGLVISSIVLSYFRKFCMICVQLLKETDNWFCGNIELLDLISRLISQEGRIF